MPIPGLSTTGWEEAPEYSFLLREHERPVCNIMMGAFPRDPSTVFLPVIAKRLTVLTDVPLTL